MDQKKKKKKKNCNVPEVFFVFLIFFCLMGGGVTLPGIGVLVCLWVTGLAN